MLKTISAALLAASVIAAPALAAEAAKETAKTAPVIKAEQTQTKASTAAVKTDSKAMNANASIAKDEHAKSTRSHRHHQKLAKKHLSTQPDVKPAVPATSGKRS